MLNRIGSKKVLASDYLALFPKHRIYIEPFFGAGGVFFQKPLSNHNFLNDIDEDVYNLFSVLKDENKREKFEKLFEIMPVHTRLFYEYKNSKGSDYGEIERAVRFVFLSNHSFMGAMDTMKIEPTNFKHMFKKDIPRIFNMLKDVTFTCYHVSELLKKMPQRCFKDTFVYCDPPYLNTENNYKSCEDWAVWQEKDLRELFENLLKTGAKFGVSEFLTPTSLQIAEDFGLNVINVLAKRNLNSENRATEIFICNYKPNLTLF